MSGTRNVTSQRELGCTAHAGPDPFDGGPSVEATSPRFPRPSASGCGPANRRTAYPLVDVGEGHQIVPAAALPPSRRRPIADIP
jgi:hypothetical protein